MKLEENRISVYLYIPWYVFNMLLTKKLLFLEEKTLINKLKSVFFSIGFVLIGIIFFGKRGMMILSCYGWFRTVDDIMDEEKAPLHGLKHEDYLKEKRVFVNQLMKCSDVNKIQITRKEDLLLLFLISQSEKHKILLKDDVFSLWSYMIKENESRFFPSLRTKEELSSFANYQDLLFVSFVSKVLRGNTNKCMDLAYRLNGFITRMDWVNDFNHDANLGIITISKEDADLHNIDENILLKGKNPLVNSDQLASWHKEERLKILKEFEKNSYFIFQIMENIFATSWIGKKAAKYLIKKRLREAMKEIRGS